MQPKLQPWEDRPRQMKGLHEGFNWNFSSNIGSPTHDQKKAWETKEKKDTERKMIRFWRRNI